MRAGRPKPAPHSRQVVVTCKPYYGQTTVTLTDVPESLLAMTSFGLAVPERTTRVLPSNRPDPMATQSTTARGKWIVKVLLTLLAVVPGKVAFTIPLRRSSRPRRRCSPSPWTPCYATTLLPLPPRAQALAIRLGLPHCAAVPETDTTTEAAQAEQPLTTPQEAETEPTAGNGAASSDNLLIEVDGKLVPNYDATIHPFSEGDVVTGQVVRIDQDEVLVDIGYKSEGVIPSNELSIRKTVKPSEEVELGEEVDALVLTKEDQEGRLILSKKRARFEKAWRKIEQAAETGEPVTGTVIEVVKGGLILDLGVRGFLPASLVDIRRVQNLDEFMGQQLECKVIELNRSRNNVVLSRRAVLEEERKEVREQILGRLQPGQVVEGTISNIVDFGAFVDLEGIDGLIHISELSWSHVNHPSEVVSIGDTVRVKVLDIDKDRQRISLGLKQTQEDPWQRVLNEYKEGDVVDGKVTKIVAFGAFVQILPGVEGLVHISELAQHHVESPAEVVRPGDELKVKILEVDEARRRLSLSVKRVEGQELPTRPVSDDVVIEDAEPPEGMEAPAAESDEEAPAHEPAAEEPAAEETAEVAAEEGEQPAAEVAPEAPPEETTPDEAPSEEPPSEEPPSEEPPSEEPPPSQG
jgi:small subunit ribosomal protein S1